MSLTSAMLRPQRNLFLGSIQLLDCGQLTSPPAKTDSFPPNWDFNGKMGNRCDVLRFKERFILNMRFSPSSQTSLPPPSVLQGEQRHLLWSMWFTTDFNWKTPMAVHPSLVYLRLGERNFCIMLWRGLMDPTLKYIYIFFKKAYLGFLKNTYFAFCFS